MEVLPIKRKIYIESSLLKLTQVEERLESKPKKSVEITWTDQREVTRDIKKLTDGHASNLASWLRDLGFIKAEKIIQGELERRCTGSYPSDFDESVKIYKSNQDIWRLQIK